MYYGRRQRGWQCDRGSAQGQKFCKKYLLKCSNLPIYDSSRIAHMIVIAQPCTFNHLKFPVRRISVDDGRGRAACRNHNRDVLHWDVCPNFGTNQLCFHVFKIFLHLYKRNHFSTLNRSCWKFFPTLLKVRDVSNKITGKCGNLKKNSFFLPKSLFFF